MITLYEDGYDGFYISDDLSVACRTTDLDDAAGAAGALVEFRVPVFLSKSHLRRALDSLGLTMELLRGIQDKKLRRAEMARALVEYGLSDPYGPRDGGPSEFVFLPPGDREGLKLLAKEGWIKLLDRRFRKWSEVMKYIEYVLDR